jgi:hypothetical protein
MRAHFLLIPAAIVASATPIASAHAKVFMNTKQAQRLMFPGASFAPHFVTLSETESAGLERKTGASLQDRKVEVWRASTGGWFFIDHVLGKDDVITYAVSLTDAGAVRQVEILECLADYDTVTMPEWRAQFQGKTAGDNFNDVETISGTTLSSRHITEGVKRILATHALIIKSSGF